MAFKLRPYQEEGINQCRDYVVKGYQGVLFAAPCGAGKGSVIAYIMKAAAQKGNKVLMLAHRTDLVAGPNAIGDRLEEQMRVGKQHIGYLMPKANFKKYRVHPRRDTRLPIVLGTVQTASRRKLPKFDILIVDEAHRIRTGSYEKTITRMLETNPNLVVMGFTATPQRLDNKSLGAIFPAVVQLASHGEMVENRYLVPSTYKYPLQVDTSKVRVRMGDYVESDLEEIYTDEVLNSIIDKWEELAKNRKKTIVFTINRKTQARVMADLYRRRGYKAEAIVSDTEDRSELLEKFERGEFQVLVNVNLFTEGLSIDDVDCILLAYATKSVVKYVQSASRGARPVWNPDHSGWAVGPDGEYTKSDCLIIDCGGNVERFGKLEDYGRDGFDLSPKDKKKRKQPAPMKHCPECYEVVAASLRTCPECGYVFPSAEDEGILASDAEWVMDDPNFAYFKKFSKQQLSYDKLYIGLRQRNHADKLLPIAAIRGYREDWAARVAWELNYGGQRKKNIKEQTDYESIIRYLRKKTKDSGYWASYKNLLEYGASIS